MDDLRREWLAAQLLHRPGSLAVPEVVGRLLAVQAQDVTAAALAFRARSTGLTWQDVEAARQERAIVRAWGPRGTLHYILPEDLGWLTSLSGPSLARDAIRRIGQEGVAGSPEALLPVVVRALEGQGPLTKEELGERLSFFGVHARGQAIVHLAALAAAHGLAVLGPGRRRDARRAPARTAGIQGSPGARAGTPEPGEAFSPGKPTYVHAADWLGAPVASPLDRDRSLAELARRYLLAHAPATPADLAAWSGLPLRDARTGWKLIAGSLEELPGAGWRLRGTASEAVARTVRLLPAFDEYLLGWRTRSGVLADAHARSVHPGGGILRPTVLVDGLIRGTWSLNGPRLTVSPFEEEIPAGEEAEDVRRFLGRDGTATAP
ncbi:winged helix DNA-binding domain-containing protein [Streptosporangium sp. NPDC000396]|uniref:winged helix DNA-binding domain-containing protein n=1 Tax=Streptosporangium sp. NPDC000396 TaxID=3366185 RepID=UPI00369BA4FF